MACDYNDGEPRQLEHLCALLRGDAVRVPTEASRQPLCELAHDHRVEPLCIRALRERGVDPAAWFGNDASMLDSERRASALDVMRTRELHTVVERLADVPGASPVLIKGAALAYTHYPRPWLRPRLDTDILVSPADVDAVHAALREVGYQRVLSTSGSVVMYQAAFERTDRFGVTHALDLHWRISNWQALSQMLSHDEIAASSVAVTAVSARARATAPVHALLIACMHRAAHHRDSEELLWLYDIHLIASRMTEAEWHEVVAAAERAGVTALCARGLLLTATRFHTPLPATIVETADAWTRSGVSEPSAVYLSKSIRLVDGLASDLRALTPRARLRLLREHLFPPAEYIRHKYGVSSPLAIAFSYLRRIAEGMPKWFASEPRT